MPSPQSMAALNAYVGSSSGGHSCPEPISPSTLPVPPPVFTVFRVLPHVASIICFTRFQLVLPPVSFVSSKVEYSLIVIPEQRPAFADAIVPITPVTPSARCKGEPSSPKQPIGAV